MSGTTRVSRYQKGKTNLDFTEARDSRWQWHHLGHMQVCTSLQTDNHASTPPISVLQAGCLSCRPTNSITALKATHLNIRHTRLVDTTAVQHICGAVTPGDNCHFVRAHSAFLTTASKRINMYRQIKLTGVNTPLR